MLERDDHETIKNSSHAMRVIENFKLVLSVDDLGGSTSELGGGGLKQRLHKWLATFQARDDEPRTSRTSHVYQRIDDRTSIAENTNAAIELVNFSTREFKSGIFSICNPEISIKYLTRDLGPGIATKTKYRGLDPLHYGVTEREDLP